MTMQWTEATFRKVTKNHVLTVVKDDGLYRHLRVGVPGTSMESWHIHTWPGYLAMVGDMGDWVFQRTDDMLSFFRGEGEALQINPGYWAEKLQASEDGGPREFSVDLFRENVRQSIMDDAEVDTWEEVPEDIREDDEIQAILEADNEYNCAHELDACHQSKFGLEDFWDGRHRHEVFRSHFLFACYAIAWTVKMYDQQKAGT